jgi:hypothetical protein
MITHIKTQQPRKPKPKKCKVCQKEGQNYATRLNGKGQRYYNLVCSTCKSAKDYALKNKYRNKLRNEDPEKYYRMRRHDQLRRYYKMSLAEYEDILLSQGGGCAICGKAESLRAMPVDHDHTTNKFRGILCHWCNKGLGQFFDNPETLVKAAEYLKKSK